MFCIHNIPNKLNSVLEIVERKGIGHPDSLADMIARRKFKSIFSFLS